MYFLIVLSWKRVSPNWKSIIKAIHDFIIDSSTYIPMRTLTTAGTECSPQTTTIFIQFCLPQKITSVFQLQFWFWRYLTRGGLIYHLSHSSIRPSNYFSLIVKSTPTPCWNQPVLSNKGKSFLLKETTWAQTHDLKGDKYPVYRSLWFKQY